MSGDTIKKPKKGGPKRASLQSYFEEIEKKDKVTIPCPHGMGTYVIRLEGAFWYGTPEITWINDDEKNPGWGRNYAAGMYKTNEGRVIPWYPRGLGYQSMSPYAYDRDIHGEKKWASNRDHNLYMARMVIGFILAGRRLWRIQCGQNINSLNDDDHLTTPF